MKKILLTISLVLYTSIALAGFWGSDSGGGVVYKSDCSTITSGFCTDTDDGVLYFWNGTAVSTSTPGEFTYPAVGLPLSTGSAWGTSINVSANVRAMLAGTNYANIIDIIGLGATDNVSFGNVTASGGTIIAGVGGTTQGALVLKSNTDPIYSFGIAPAALPTAIVSLKAPPSMPTADNSLFNCDINGTCGWTDPATFGGDNLGSASATDVATLFSGTGDYLKTDGSRGTPTGTFSWPSAGVVVSTGSAAGTSLTVGGGAVGELVQAQSDGIGGMQLPFAIDIAGLTDTTGVLTAKANVSCFASESAFNTCFDLTWATGGVSTFAALSDLPSGVTLTTLGYAASGATGNIQGQIEDLQSEIVGLSVGGISSVSSDPAAPADGFSWYNSTDHTLNVSQSTGWTKFAGTFTAWDTTPIAFSFTDETNIALSTAKTSNAITVAGINHAAAISVAGDTGYGYAKNGAGCTATSGTVALGDTVSACVTSSASNSTATTSTVTIGGVSDTYSVTTAAPGVGVPVFAWNGDNVGGVLVAEKESGTTTGTLITATTAIGSSDPGTASSDGGTVLKIPGAGSLRFLDSGIANMQTGYLSMLVYIPASVTGYNEFFEITDSGNSYYLYFSVMPDKHIRFQTTTPSTVQNDSTTTVFTSGWQLFEARWSTTNTSIRVNGGSWETLNSGFTTAQTAGRVYLGYNSQIITNTIYIDGVELWDTYDQQ